MAEIAVGVVLAFSAGAAVAWLLRGGQSKASLASVEAHAVELVPKLGVEANG